MELRELLRAAGRGIVLVASLVLLGCGGGEDRITTLSSDGPAFVEGTAMLGTVTGATVTAVELNANGAELHTLVTTSTDGQGSYHFLLGPGYQGGPILLKLRGGGGATALCDVTGGCGDGYEWGAAVPLASSVEMRALLPPASSGARIHAQITPFTHMAEARARANAGGLSAAVINAANSEVSHLVGVDVLATTPADLLDELSVSSADGRVYAAFISAATAWMVENGGYQAGLAALAQMFLDGQFTQVDGDYAFIEALAGYLREEADAIFPEAETPAEVAHAVAVLDEADVGCESDGSCVYDPEPASAPAASVAVAASVAAVEDPAVAQARALVEELRGWFYSIGDLEDPLAPFQADLGPGLQFIRAQIAIGQDIGDTDFLPDRIGHADNGRHLHFRMAFDHVLNFARIHIVPARFVHFLGSPDDGVGTVRIAPAEVSGGKPSVLAQCFGGCIRALPVAEHVVDRAGLNFAGDAIFLDDVGAVREANFNAVYGPADTAGEDRKVAHRRDKGHAAAALRHTVIGGERCTVLQEAGEHVVWHGRAFPYDQLNRGKVRLCECLLGILQLEHAGHGRPERQAFLLHEFQRPAGREVFEETERTASHERRCRYVHNTADMVDRKIVERAQRRYRPDPVLLETEFHDAFMMQKGALGPSGRSGCIDDHAGIPPTAGVARRSQRFFRHVFAFRREGGKAGHARRDAARVFIEDHDLPDRGMALGQLAEFRCVVAPVNG